MPGGVSGSAWREGEAELAVLPPGDGQLGVVGVPHAVRPGWAELPATQVGCRRGLWVTAGQARPPPPASMAAHQPSVRISRATRLRPTRTPQAICSSAWILGAP